MIQYSIRCTVYGYSYIDSGYMYSYNCHRNNHTKNIRYNHNRTNSTTATNNMIITVIVIYNNIIIQTYNNNII